MSLFKIHIFYIILFTFLLTQNLLFAQISESSYVELWRKIESNTSNEKDKLNYIDEYIYKAQAENNLLEKYKALDYKTYLVSYKEAVKLFDEISSIVNQLQNDSIKGAFINTKALFYYKNRQFQQALDYAIEAERISEKTNNLYNFHSIRTDIGNIYYHTMNYEKALCYFNSSKEYFRSQSTTNNQINYIVNLYGLGKIYWQLEDSTKLDVVIKESQKAIEELPSKYQEFETGYLNYIKGGSYFLKNDFENAKKHFDSSLPILKSNRDFTNENIVFLYLGKIAWEQNQKQIAISYFQRIDELFRSKSFLNYELREAYEYLITYYKENDEPKLQLEATENLLLLNKQFEKEQLSVTNTLHTELDTKKWQSSKEELQNQLSNNKKWYLILGFGFTVIVFYSYWLRNERKRLKRKFEQLIQNIEREKIAISSIVESSESKNGNNLLGKETFDSNSTEMKLLKLLQIFEEEKGYLSPLKLEDLALRLGTNRTTLSAVLNEHKGGFLGYINRLRIEQLLSEITTRKDLREKPISELLEMYGFVNEKTFVTHFKKHTGLTPSYFIKQLDLGKARN